ncbi:ATP-binding protein [Achromobacter pestifer]
MFSPRKLVESTTRSFAAQARQKNLLLFSTTDQSVIPWATGDTSNLRQILSNLLSNALSFTESGHVIVRLRGGDRTDGVQRLTLQVVDTGIGINREDQAGLFNSVRPIGHAVHGRRTGLAHCAHLAQLMGSHIRVTSEPGLGSSFSLDLALPASEGPAVDIPDLRGIRVLARSPHRELSNNVCSWLSRWGANATPATDPIPCGASDDVFLDLLTGSGARPAHWTGHYLSTCAPGPFAADTIEPLDGYDLEGIGSGIARLVHGTPLTQPPEGVPPPPPIPHRFRRLFLDTMHDDLDKLEQAIARRDAFVALQALHRMRGALMMVAMTTLANDIKTVDTTLRGDGWNEQAFLETSRLVLEIRDFLIQV